MGKSIFSELQFDSDTKNYDGQIKFNNRDFVDLTISIEMFDKDKVFKLAENTFKKIEELEEIYKESVAEDLLTIHNETWNEESITSKSEFINRIKLEGILFFCDGNAELYYNDGDLFWGHTIVVSINENGQYQDSQIYG
ncbi:MAG: DUF2262 domain-containing protein [Lysinibacillus sp.]